ncbi:peptidyl-prolyl cis-trans isomerase [Aurantimonas sp. HBX-1]|uniref:peptidylprolyl isomerase n=1 Tax=Aurantimonas sp. HBX-1 TaxID=2906072 RepID=UPI001F267DF1|nr:peptidyl-prolyl cis-trans isomerase [Aurantimonas sp. HBX-1]UIJ72443.1 peptidyl-prolyl cis-trans isomerase [Aurantimonas sp. HBX-1]
MTIDLRLTLAASAIVLAVLAGPARAADADIVAKVGDAEITEGDLSAAQKEIGAQFQQLPEEQRRLAVLSALIDIKALAQEAEEAKLQDEPAVASEIDFQRDRALHNAFFAKNGVATVTEDELKARYDAEIGAMPATEEVHARHILVKTKEEAQAAIKRLDEGADFATVAKEMSTGPSGPEGGDLGFFRAGQMVPAFEAAAFALEPGQYSKEPVETQFGWHVIRVEEKRQAEPPSYDQVKEQVRQVVLREKYMELVRKARTDLTVEYVDPALKQQIEAIEGAMEPAPADAPAAETPPAE